MHNALVLIYPGREGSQNANPQGNIGRSLDTGAGNNDDHNDLGHDPEPAEYTMVPTLIPTSLEMTG